MNRLALIVVLVALVSAAASLLRHAPTPVPPPPATVIPPAPAQLPKPQPISRPVLKPTSLPFPESASTEQQLDELHALAAKPSTPATEDALRWTIWQPSFNETLRNEAVKTLLAWNPDWLVPDLLQLTRDEKQSPKWRGWCVQYLELHYRERKDSQSAQGMFDAAGNENIPAVKTQALFSLAVTSRDLEWKKTDPARFGKLKGLVSAELPKQVPSDSQEKSGVTEALLDAASQAELRNLTPVIEQMAGDAKCISRDTILIMIMVYHLTAELERIECGRGEIDESVRLGGWNGGRDDGAFSCCQAPLRFGHGFNAHCVPD